MREYPTEEQAEQLRKQYPLGTRICVDRDTDTEQRVPPGTFGTVIEE